MIFLSRLILGWGESWLATGSCLWGIARVGQEHTAQVISWSGICSYGGIAIGAPLGVWILKAWGLSGVGLVSVGYLLRGPADGLADRRSGGAGRRADGFPPASCDGSFRTA